MAGDWIKIEHATPDKPEVVMMADELDIDQDAVTGKLLRLWIWADQNIVDGNAVSVTDAFLNRLVFCDTFASALRSVGWLDGDSGELSLPGFSNHNGETAKKRASTNRRVTKSRELKRNCNVSSVTLSEQKALPEKRREEKRRMDKNIPPNPQGGMTQIIGMTQAELKTSLQKKAEAIYAEYPKKVGKDAAVKSILKALKYTDAESLTEAAQAYAKAVVNKDRQFIPNPATWFNQGRYNDDRSEWGDSSTTKPEFDLLGGRTAMVTKVADIPDDPDYEEPECGL